MSPDYLQRNIIKVNKYLKPWIDRDLSILVGEDNVELISAFVMALIISKHIQSDESRTELQGFLGLKTEHFIHELTAFASSSWNMSTFDQIAEFE
jgi:hypothetical protein